jgi:hypothetical protein
VALSTVIWILGAVVVAFLVWRVGIAMLRSLTTPMPPPPPAGELRKVNLRYRCSICGMEIRLTLANDEDPEPPRHCQEEMDLVAPVE